ncbi:MAG: dethiobiotin synthetase [Saprospiraceae bacterium]|jgi:dethiobiotin synthetase
MRKIFVTGIGTDVGKTVVSAILVEALQADYWKPIQCGGLELTDTDRVKRLVSSSTSCFHPETYSFSHPVSPHEAAKLNNTKIRLGKLNPPETENTLIIEGAGGITVPYNYRGDSMLEIAQHCEAEIVIVANSYLGSINHTILTIEYLKNQDVKILGVIFNGICNDESEQVILNKTKITCLGRIPQEFEISKDLIKKYAHDYVFI